MKYLTTYNPKGFVCNKKHAFSVNISFLYKLNCCIFIANNTKQFSQSEDTWEGERGVCFFSLLF